MNSKDFALHPTPQSTIFAFDVNNVVIVPKMGAMVATVFSQLPWRGFIVLFFDVLYWLTILRKGAVDERYVDRMCKKYQQYGITKQFFIKLINTQQLNKPVVALMEQLKKQGYHLYLASNLWPDLYHDFQQKFPVIKNMVDGHYIPTAKNSFIEKPAHAYYVDFKEYLAAHGHAQAHVIFIDDNYDNVRAAVRAHFIAIQYRSIDQLLCDLREQGIRV